MLNSFLLLLLLLLVFGAQQIKAREIPLAPHVIVIGVDGLGGDWLLQANATSIKSLISRGTSTLVMQNVIGTSSSQNWFSMIGGSGPDVHGVKTNAWERGDSETTPTVFAVLKEQRPKAKVGIFHQWKDFGRLVEDWAADVKISPGDQVQTTNAAVEYFKKENPALLFVHLDHVDGAGHDSFWGSEQYLSAIEEADRLIGNVLRAVEEVRLSDETVIVVSSDHGGTIFGWHGPNKAECRNVPFVIAGPGIALNKMIQREVRIFDVGVTLAEVLALKFPTSWTGSPIYEVFQDFILPPAPVVPLKVGYTSHYQFQYDSSGEEGLIIDNFSIWRPIIPEGAIFLGDVLVKGNFPPKFPTPYFFDDPVVFAYPTQHEQIFTNEKSATSRIYPLALWQPVPPFGFTCVGDIATQVFHLQPSKEISHRCIHTSYLIKTTSELVMQNPGFSTLQQEWWMNAWAAAKEVRGINPNTFVTHRRNHGFTIDTKAQFTL